MAATSVIIKILQNSQILNTKIESTRGHTLKTISPPSMPSGRKQQRQQFGNLSFLFTKSYTSCISSWI